MKRLLNSSIALMGILTVVVTLMISSCTKEGPMGPAGTNGKDGKDGADGNATCGACHDLSVDLYAKIMQYDASTHAVGGNFERNGTTCAICHTHQGFLEYLETGNRFTAVTVQDPVAVNCRTCHKIHETYSAADYALRVESAFKLDINEADVDFGKSNLCARCHQPRIPEPEFDPTADSITITSYRWGYHHATQAAMLSQTGGYEVPGSLSYAKPASSHMSTVTELCTECHMAPAFGIEAGGHTWNMEYNVSATTGVGTPNIIACTPCHTGLTNFNYNNVQTDITLLLDSLKNVLVAEGIMYSTGGSWYIKAGKYTTEQAGWYLNYQFVKEDYSLGVHNSKYAKALLVNTIEAVQSSK